LKENNLVFRLAENMLNQFSNLFCDSC